MSRNLVTLSLLMFLAAPAKAEMGVNELNGFSNEATRGSARFVNATSGSSTNGGDVSLGTYASLGTADQDHVVVVCACSSTSAGTDPMPLSPPSGLTELLDQTNSASTARMSTSSGFVTSTNAATTVSCHGSGGSTDATVGVMFVFRGVRQSGQPDLTTTNSGSGSSPVVFPGGVITPNEFMSTTIEVCSNSVNDSSIAGPAGGLWLSSAPGFQAVTANDTGTDQSMAASATTQNKHGHSVNYLVDNFGTWTSGTWVCATVSLYPF